MSDTERDARLKRLSESINNGETIDLPDEAINMDDMKEMMEPLTEEQQKDVRKAIAPIADGWQDILNWAMEGLQDDEAREKFVEEAKKRYAHL